MGKHTRAVMVRNVGIRQMPGQDQMNRGGGLAFSRDPRTSLYLMVAASLWSGDGYYEKQHEWQSRFRDTVKAVIDSGHSRFPFALAAYARDRRAGLGLRASPIALYGQAASHVGAKGTGYVRAYAPKILQRADEPSEIIAYCKANFPDKAVPHGILRGIADVLPGFDAYQLGKYKETGRLRHVLRLARPHPSTDDLRGLWGRALKGEIEPPFTWEVELSKAHGDDEKRAVWNGLIKSGSLGTFAIVRNIRNMADVGADIETALAQLTAERVRSSGIFPFQWWKAYLAISEKHGKALGQVAIDALETCLANLPRLPGRTLVVCDNSGSMDQGSQTRGMSNADLGNLLGAMAVRVCQEARAGTFGDTFGYANVGPDVPLVTAKARIDKRGDLTGHSTNAWKVLQSINRDGERYDRVILLSDMQCYDSGARYHLGYGGQSLAAELDSYRERVNPGVQVYSINVATQDNTCQWAPGQPVLELAGFSERIFEFIAAVEAGGTMVDQVLARY